jgi:hypothetical protein
VPNFDVKIDTKHLLYTGIIMQESTFYSVPFGKKGTMRLPDALTPYATVIANALEAARYVVVNEVLSRAAQTQIKQRISILTDSEVVENLTYVENALKEARDADSWATAYFWRNELSRR